MLLVDSQIRNLCLNALHHKGKPLVEPFSEATSGNGIVSYGLTSAGYDLRLAGEFLLCRSPWEVAGGEGRSMHGIIMDPRRFADPVYRETMFRSFRKEPGEEMLLPGHASMLARSLETIRMPKNLKGRCVGKSTLARCFVIVNVTPLEPGWEGTLTIEVTNLSPCPVVLRVGEGICQLEFETLTTVPDECYAAKQGKYMHQDGVTVARVL